MPKIAYSPFKAHTKEDPTDAESHWVNFICDFTDGLAKGPGDTAGEKSDYYVATFHGNRGLPLSNPNSQITVIAHGVAGSGKVSSREEGGFSLEASEIVQRMVTDGLKPTQSTIKLLVCEGAASWGLFESFGTAFKRALHERKDADYTNIQVFGYTKTLRVEHGKLFSKQINGNFRAVHNITKIASEPDAPAKTARVLIPYKKDFWNIF